ncbi:hypothetical protein D3879_03710 [Pseudomonas cavernicola]|uniref:Uncharacterized protein n=1 Tax=Pseudomonas cavernicola TaxID=2320866 RepID=A0A418XIU7_9PSED|nr:pyocin S6 family toxin immunity protein [Pseudomonas cavernicola]RJG12408.1 hypothetical protein D3879_03710 [Pseudomonas cavernicola]
MKYELKYEIHGAPENSDLAVFETNPPSTVTTEALMPIMGWQSEEDAVSTYLLSAEQTKAIESLAAIELPKDLELYLSCYA